MGEQAQLGCPNVMIDGITILQGYHSCQPSRPRGPCRAPQPTCSKLWSTVSPGEADRRQGINLDSSAGLTMKLVRRTDEIWADEDMRPPVLRLKRTVHSCRSVFYVAGSLAVLLVLVPATAGETKPLRGHVPGAVTDLHPIGRLSATNYLHLAIGLPLRDSAGLKHLLEQLYDPASHKFHQFLTPEQFTERFGPSAADYQAVINFARSNALTVTATHPNRALVDVTSSVADVERAFHVKMLEDRHPREDRTFYAPDNDPSFGLSVELLHVSGLDNYVLPHPANLTNVPCVTPDGAPHSCADVGTGSGLCGALWGYDFRARLCPRCHVDRYRSSGWIN